MRRFFLFLSAIVMVNAMIVGQNHAQYNSFCIYDNASDASLYTCASVDSITFEQHDGAISQVVWRGDERIVSPVSLVDSISFYNPYVEGIVEISEGFDVWDKAYVTPIGYFSYKSALVAEGEDFDSDQYETLAYANFDDTQAATLILSKNDSLPVWLIIDSLTCTFGYLPEDSLCHLTIGCDSAVVCELEFHYNDSIVTARNQYTDHELKRCLWIVTSLLEGNTAECQAITGVVAKFKTLLTVGEEDSEPKLPKKPISKKLKVKIDVYYGVGAGTYGAYYITSSSAVLQGCVYCASAQRDSASVYGILCDENPENLTIEKAKHNFVGHQERMKLRYEVQATGLKPNTNYYYRAYVRIKKGKNDLQYSYAGDKAANAAYGKVRKFKTEEAGLCSNHNHPHMIDLGLPSGTKWACCNVGASSPEGYGGYYTWDEAMSYQLPTLYQIQELCDNCTWQWTTINGVNGQKVTGPNGNCIFLPAAGRRNGTEVYGRGSYGIYWSGSLYEYDSNEACGLVFDSGYLDWYDYDRIDGHSVRPVTD